MRGCLTRLSASTGREPARSTPRAGPSRSARTGRYAVVVQASAYHHLSTWLVAPTTTKSFGSMIHRSVELLGQDVRVLVEQTTAVDSRRLGDFAGLYWSKSRLLALNWAFMLPAGIR